MCNVYMEWNLVLERGTKVFEYEKKCVKTDPLLTQKRPPNEIFNAKFGIGASLKKEESHNTRYSPSVGAMNIKWLFGSSKMKQPL